MSTTHLATFEKALRHFEDDLNALVYDVMKANDGTDPEITGGDQLINRFRTTYKELRRLWWDILEHQAEYNRKENENAKTPLFS